MQTQKSIVGPGSEGEGRCCPVVETRDANEFQQFLLLI